MAPSYLARELERALPQGVKLSVRHIACPPTPCEPIFAPPPGDDPEPTNCESHFFAISIRPSDASSGTDTDTDIAGEILVFAIEVIVYTTARLTTVFVSKADSTGYLYLLNQPTVKSLTRIVFTTFLSHILRQSQRPGIRLVLSLFARAQSQYLFPGSDENKHKHLLDDRGLIKWWCRVFDPLLRDYELERQNTSKKNLDDPKADGAEARNATATAYLIIPGCDKHETKAFFPPTARSDPQNKARWLSSYPLHQICPTPNAPPRCLVPRFPDDPKARFLDQLDDEICGLANTSKRRWRRRHEQVTDLIDETATSHESHVETGQWLSVKTLEQFWEMMTFRQECSAGRLVGFLWMIINPPGVLKSDGLNGDITVKETGALNEPVALGADAVAATETKYISVEIPIRPANPMNGDSNFNSTLCIEESTEKTSSQIKNNGRLEPIPNGPPTSAEAKQPEKTILLTFKQYSKLSNFLLTLDFANQSLALTSTKSWLDKLSSFAGHSDHEEVVVGAHRSSTPSSSAEHTNDPSIAPVNNLIVKKRKIHVETDSPAPATQESSSTTVNVLNATLIRKKRKTDIAE